MKLHDVKANIQIPELMNLAISGFIKDNRGAYKVRIHLSEVIPESTKYPLVEIMNGGSWNPWFVFPTNEHDVEYNFKYWAEYSKGELINLDDNPLVEIVP